MIGRNLSYTTYQGVLENAGIGLTPAELHGGITGALSSGGLPAALGWLRQCLGDVAESSDAGDRARLRALAESTLTSLQAHELAFEPMLPEDTAELGQRVEALALWCHGFLEGLAVGGLPAKAELAGSLEEIVRDFAEISRARLGVAERERAEEKAEFDLFEVAEYVRVGAQLAFEELAPIRTVASESPGGQ